MVSLYIVRLSQFSIVVIFHDLNSNPKTAFKKHDSLNHVPTRHKHKHVYCLNVRMYHHTEVNGNGSAQTYTKCV